jgi:hypothetical protein
MAFQLVFILANVRLDWEFNLFRQILPLMMNVADGPLANPVAEIRTYGSGCLRRGAAE